MWHHVISSSILQFFNSLIGDRPWDVEKYDIHQGREGVTSEKNEIRRIIHAEIELKDARDEVNNRKTMNLIFILNILSLTVT